MLPPPKNASAALVTGASSGLGLSLARALASRGYNLILTARREDRLRALAEELSTKYAVRAEAIPCDLTDRSAPESLLEAVDRCELEIDILVNNAGIYWTGRFQDADVQVQLDIVRIKIDAAIALSGRLLPAMVRRGRGAVLNISSTTAFQPLARNATYAAANAFLLSFTEALHSDLTGTGVTATALCPGPMNTELASTAGDTATTMTDRIPGLFWMKSDEVAEDAINALNSGKRVVVPGVINEVGTIFGRFAPRGVLLPLFGAVSDAISQP
ncbi:SDR family NAD(P)-dependent oxidoreductase [Nocardia sp. NPDC055029]